MRTLSSLLALMGTLVGLGACSSETSCETVDATCIDAACTTPIDATPIDAAVVAFTVGGSVSGLGGVLVLQNDGGELLAIQSNGPFEFVTGLDDGDSYDVTIAVQPVDQECAVTDGSGQIDGVDVTDVVATCVDTFTVGGMVAGLSGMLVLQNNGGDDLLLGGDGSFTFPTPIVDGGDYLVTVLAHPVGQKCQVEEGSGTISTADVTDISVICADHKIIMFATGSTNGNLGGRAGIDSTCAAQATSLALACDSVRGFVSVGDTDEIRDIPANYDVPTGSNVESPNGTLLQTDWAGLLGGSIITSLVSAGVLLNSDTFWWSGSNADGSLAGTHCTGWTSSSTGQAGNSGYYNQTGVAWLAAGIPSCNQSHKAMCLCY